MHQKPKLVKKLEEKLFILWGNLLELKRKGLTLPLPSGDSKLQNMPFEVCLLEHGSPNPKWPQGYQRMHNLFSTTIMD